MVQILIYQNNFPLLNYYLILMSFFIFLILHNNFISIISINNKHLYFIILLYINIIILFYLR